MLTVRYPSGFSVQYNDANHVRYLESGAFEICKKVGEARTWIATLQASSGALVECVRPCRTYNATPGTNEQILEAFVERMRSMSGSDLKCAKKALRAFNSTTGEWSE